MTPSRPAPLSSAERKRRQRERERTRRAGGGAGPGEPEPVLFETEDWQLFLDWDTLPQKAGCFPYRLPAIVIKELVDNALDAGANATLSREGAALVVADDGPGLDPADVPRLFTVRRPLRSTKRARRPLRGMIGNGLRVVAGAVAATGGRLVVETRGRRLTLLVSPETGQTEVISDEPVDLRPGLRVSITLGRRSWRRDDEDLGRKTIEAAAHGRPYAGASSPWWYGPKDLHTLFMRATPDGVTVGAVCRSIGFGLADDRPARTLSRSDAASVLAALRDRHAPVSADGIGFIGPHYRPRAKYERKTDSYARDGAEIPFVIEAWASFTANPGARERHVASNIILNRSATAAQLAVRATSEAVVLRGCGLYAQSSPGLNGAGRYDVTLGVTAPHIQLATDGKEPDLSPFRGAIAAALTRACNAAHRAAHRPERNLSLKDAAYAVMAEAYAAASGSLKMANARQVMYSGRRAILEATGKDSLDSAYFTQTLLPNYIAEHPEETAEWDVVYDERGHVSEPHTGKKVGLGTVSVRQYLGGSERAPAAGRPSVAVAGAGRYPTLGPENRYSSVLFIEKEGFDPLLEKAGIAERFDIAIMSTKGMSVTTARMLIDGLWPRIRKVLVLRDFDVSGFSILGTLGTDSRRYTFENPVEVVDLGLRLADVEAMGLQSERVKVENWDRRAETLERHGATWEEINFLNGQRVELNAMTSDQFIAFVERKLTENGVRKVVPDERVLEEHARRVLEAELLGRLLREHGRAIRDQAAAAALPEDLDERVRALLKEEPSMPWDEAVARVVREAGGAETT